jgi:hypothetical protein
MTWEYRIIKDKGGYTVREYIVLDKDSDSWTVDEVSPYGETRDELRQSFSLYLQAVHRPVIVTDGDDIVGEEPPIVELDETGDNP